MALNGYQCQRRKKMAAKMKEENESYHQYRHGEKR